MHTYCILQNYTLYVFLQQVWCVDNCIIIWYFYVASNIIKCNEIIVKNKKTEIQLELKNMKKK